MADPQNANGMIVEERPPTVPDHELLKCIGRGSYGTVWLARSVLGAFRAVKVIRRRSFVDQRPYDREFAGIMRYEPVSRAHPGLVSVLHTGHNREEESFYYIMEVADDVESGTKIDPDHYEPKTLRTILTNSSAIPAADCLRIGLELSSALAYLHSAGLVHRDLKPSNVIFVNHAAKLADIGLVTTIGESPTFVGSEGYVPPEGPGKPAADIFGLGKVLFEALSGLDQSRYPEMPSELGRLPDAPLRRQLFEIIGQACQLNQLRRFPSGREVHERLLTLANKAEMRTSPGTAPSPAGSTAKAPLNVVIAGRPTAGPGRALIDRLQGELEQAGGRVFVDDGRKIDVAWARLVEQELAGAAVVIAVLTPETIESEVLAYELQLAHAQASQRDGRPLIVPLRLAFPDPLPEPLASLLGHADRFAWEGPADHGRVIEDILRFIGRPAAATQPPVRLALESIGGAVPLDSRFYLERPADQVFGTAIAQGESIVLVKGARQMGKTSLLARGLNQAREAGCQVVHTDFQKLNAACFQSIDHFYFELATLLSDQLKMKAQPEDVWDSRRTPNSNFERFLLREVLTAVPARLVWGMDEIDRLLVCPFGSEVLSLLRSWHNSRALDPSVLWTRLTLAIAYATEAHLFITDLVQSPFNVGVRVLLEDFQPKEVAALNARYGEPLIGPEELDRFQRLFGGQPYLVRRGLNELAGKQLTLDQLEAQAVQDQGIFADHLRRLVMVLAKDPVLVEAVRRVVRGETLTENDGEAFQRLRAAGVLVGDSATVARPRCHLYAAYFARHLT
jgi:hypothetical protein